MERYNVKYRIPSCAVNKELLNTLELYILDKAKEYFPDIPDIKSHYHFIITDKIGVHALDKVSTMVGSKFPNDIRDAELDFSRYSTEIRVRFSLNPWMSEVTISLEGASAKDHVKAIKSGIDDIIRNHKNFNFLFHTYTSSSWLLIFLNFLFFMITIMIGIGIFFMLGNKNYHMAKILISIFTFCFFYLIPAKFFKPYIAFDTIRNNSLSKFFWWGFTALSGFIIYNMFGLKIIELFNNKP